MMRDGNFGRFVLFSFPIGCDSESSVALATTTATATTHSSKNKHSKSSGEIISKKEKSSCGAKAKKNGGLSKESVTVSQGLHKLINRIFKSFSHLFLYKEAEMEHFEKEMEIGLPTDVKHVTHIGLDGSTRGINNPIPISNNNNYNINNNPEFPSISLEQFELAMNAQLHGPLPVGYINGSNQVEAQFR